MGKPVVTTHFSSDLDSFAEVVYIATNYQTFLNFIEQAMIEDDEIRRINRTKIAKQNNWNIRVNHLNHLIEEKLN